MLRLACVFRALGPPGRSRGGELQADPRRGLGALLLLPRTVHEAIGGFDLTIKVAEDQDSMRRLARVGRYGFLRRPSIEIASPRFDQEGSFWISLKWIGIELHRMIIGEIRGEHLGYFK